MVGGVAGVVMTWGVIVPTITAELEAMTEGVDPMIAACDDRLVPLEKQLQQVTKDRDTQSHVVNELRASVKHLDGTPVSWDKVSSTVFQEEMIRVLVESALEKTKNRLTLLQYSCEEFPCIVVVEGRQKRYFDAFLEALTERGFEGLEILNRSAGLPGSRSRTVWMVTYWDALEAPSSIRVRITHRMDQLMEALMDPRSGDGK
jgi:hypothetical protein